MLERNPRAAGEIHWRHRSRHCPRAQQLILPRAQGLVPRLPHALPGTPAALRKPGSRSTRTARNRSTPWPTSTPSSTSGKRPRKSAAASSPTIPTTGPASTSLPRPCAPGAVEREPRGRRATARQHAEQRIRTHQCGSFRPLCRRSPTRQRTFPRGLAHGSAFRSRPAAVSSMLSMLAIG